MVYRYFYKCNTCSKDYIEQRTETESQYVLTCQCGGSFIEESSIFLEEIPSIEAPTE